MDPLADDLVLLCWDGARGKVQPRCAQRLPAAVGGALLLDGVFDGWLVVEDERVLAPQGEDVEGVRDPLVAQVVERAATRRRPPKVARMVAWAGSSRRVADVRRRLVERGTLRAENRKALGILAFTRHPVSDTVYAANRRDAMRSLLLGEAEPHDVDVREVALAALLGPTGAVDGLVPKERREDARERADDLAEGHGLPEEVGEAVQRVQAAATAAVATAGAGVVAGGAG